MTDRDRQRIDAFERDWERRRSELAGCRGIINGLLLSAALMMSVAALGIIAGWW